MFSCHCLQMFELSHQLRLQWQMTGGHAVWKRAVLWSQVIDKTTHSSIANISFIQMQFTVFLSYRVYNQISVKKMMQLALTCILRKGPGLRSKSIPSLGHGFCLKPFGTSVVRFLRQCVFYFARQRWHKSEERYFWESNSFTFLSFHLSILVTGIQRMQEMVQLEIQLECEAE